MNCTRCRAVIDDGKRGSAAGRVVMETFRPRLSGGQARVRCDCGVSYRFWAHDLLGIVGMLLTIGAMVPVMLGLMSLADQIPGYLLATMMVAGAFVCALLIPALLGSVWPLRPDEPKPSARPRKR